MPTAKELFTSLLNKSVQEMNAVEQHVLEHLSQREPISRDTQQDYAEKLTLGQRVADKVASFGGSWPFIGLFTLFLLLWIGGNTALLLMLHKKPVDPFPFILLNLFLSMLAAIQAPVIMMSQNRQTAHDRLEAEHDYEVNLKAELEIMALHQKLDELREQQWQQLLLLQQEQIHHLQAILEKLDSGADQPG